MVLLEIFTLVGTAFPGPCRQKSKSFSFVKAMCRYQQVASADFLHARKDKEDKKKTCCFYQVPRKSMVVNG